MKIEKITLTNFRQYFGSITADLQTDEKRNIVLIGGKNGYGKTNLLIALVWCLYGEKISQVDENFKKEVQKDSNYSRFLKQSLNWDAQREGNLKYNIELVISDIEIPTNSDRKFNGINKCIIRRECDLTNMIETFSIFKFNSLEEIFDNEEDKINFVNDFLIPIEAGKFVFFDAEKIASLAELSTKDEGTILNDAFGKLLGLDIYKGLEEDLRIYVNNLKKEGANENIRDQITNCEKTIELNNSKIDEIDQKIAQNEKEIKEKKLSINEYNTFLNTYSKKELFSFNRDNLLEKKRVLLEKEHELGARFNELSEIIPLAMLAGKLNEVAEHLRQQDEINLSKEGNVKIIEKFDTFIERLFNQPPEPQDSPMPFKTKIFYSEKAQKLLDSIFQEHKDIKELAFEHDLSNSDKELINNALQSLKQQTKEFFEQNFENFNIVQNEIQEITKLIRQIDSNLQDELVLEYLTKKEDAERKVERLIADNGALINQKEELLKQIHRETQRYQVLLQKVTVTEQRKQKLEKANQYISVLQEFIVDQKKQKKDNLSKNIFAEMQKLMHKLQTNENKFISDVQVEILPDDTGLKVTLFDEKGQIRPKESLSQGEKQLYISSLIKSILSEAIQNFPLFIDTPLGRLDDEHIKNILLYYYPDLADQVIILATNNEITPKRFNDLKDYISQSYLLENLNNRTSIKQGYFQGHEN